MSDDNAARAERYADKREPRYRAGRHGKQGDGTIIALWTAARDGYFAGAASVPCPAMLEADARTLAEFVHSIPRLKQPGVPEIWAVADIPDDVRAAVERRRSREGA